MNEENHWSRFADDFEKRVIHVAGLHNIETIRDTLSSQNLSGTVLELGCGNGTYSTVLARKAECLHVTDFSDQMVAVCQTRLAQMDNVVVEKQNCLALTYPDETFDAVVLVNLLHVIETPEKAVTECRRVLKPGGRIIVVSFTMEGMGFFAMAAMLYRYLRVYGRPPAKSRRLTVDATRKMLEDGGFHVHETFLTGRGTKAVFAWGTSLPPL